ncbi:hypothetical protein F4819DRAFT_507469 [Hypoxylon fuscum]|nr:hypothetical protein F4819DRAFT_507469 [Hypoxylon fuscum]
MAERIADLIRRIKATEETTKIVEEAIEVARRKREAVKTLNRLHTFSRFFHNHHDLHHSMEIIINGPLTTQMDTATANKVSYYPIRTAPWDSFQNDQAEILGELFASSFSFNSVFSSNAGFKDIKSPRSNVPDRSPFQTPTGCQPLKDDGDGDGDDAPPSATRAYPSIKTLKNSNNNNTLGNREQPLPTKTCISDQPYCTQACLMGLANGGPTDKECPNSAHHGPQHLELPDFQLLIRVQLAIARGPDADAMPLHLPGSEPTGSLFKVRLANFGYTLVAKGVAQNDLQHLQRENDVYDRLRYIQGEYVPVCLGNVTLALSHHYLGDEYQYFMLLSWAG